MLLPSTARAADILLKVFSTCSRKVRNDMEQFLKGILAPAPTPALTSNDTTRCDRVKQKRNSATDEDNLVLDQFVKKQRYNQMIYNDKQFDVLSHDHCSSRLYLDRNLKTSPYHGSLGEVMTNFSCDNLGLFGAPTLEMASGTLSYTNALISPQSKTTYDYASPAANFHITSKVGSAGKSIVSHQKKVDDYFSTPKPSSKSQLDVTDPHCRPIKCKKSSSSSSGNNSQQAVAEPMITDDICQCCFRLLCDVTVWHKCCFCMKVGCASCVSSCDACSEVFCLHCSTSNYSSSYERILCLDCQGDGR